MAAQLPVGPERIRLGPCLSMLHMHAAAVSRWLDARSVLLQPPSRTAPHRIASPRRTASRLWAHLASPRPASEYVSSPLLPPAETQSKLFVSKVSVGLGPSDPLAARFIPVLAPSILL
ncbi:predicted membrane protein [Moesziomyces antarcticus T-34]|uniref:Predicted membrane protein n=1 Tax=Pseudozyma antarctica (strain T-34) TaxID=1151754 RepID=M9M2E8_PSEA3|nr:predicted membrane protein [Moesziomyces antarcticus T-34]